LTRPSRTYLDAGVSGVTVLHLIALDAVDNTGIAVLFAAGRDLKAAGSRGGS
jgi:hypothetical protein